MAVLDNLEPKSVFYFFEEFCKVPHETFDMDRISEFCVNFAKERGLDYIQDEAKNVIIKKPGTPGYENSEPVILQGHMDMVCEKVPGSAHDFKTEGLELFVEDGYIGAKDTSLGGDDGIAVAMGMALLDSKDIPHPPLEVIFTVDEETGMGGAIALDMSELKGKKVINMDSEAEGILTTGCAGGINHSTYIPVNKETVEGTKLSIKVGGLLGGHSGNEIQKERGNANKMMGRLLNEIQKETKVSIIKINGGSKANVITPECISEVIVADADKAKEVISNMLNTWLDEFAGFEPDLKVDVQEESSVHEEAFDADSTKRVIMYLLICPQGVQTYDRSLANTVETSLNLGVVATEENRVVAKFQIRSSVESKKWALEEQIEYCAQLVGGSFEITGQYPGWKYAVESPLREVMMSTYEEMYGTKPEIVAIHAGLECGYFLSKRPDLDIVSFGPNMLEIHSFNERLDIESTKRSWEYLLAILAKLK